MPDFPILEFGSARLALPSLSRWHNSGGSNSSRIHSKPTGVSRSENSSSDTWKGGPLVEFSLIGKMRVRSSPSGFRSLAIFSAHAVRIEGSSAHKKV